MVDSLSDFGDVVSISRLSERQALLLSLHLANLLDLNCLAERELQLKTLPVLLAREVRGAQLVLQASCALGSGGVP